MAKSKKTFDAVKSSRMWRSKVSRKTTGMTRDEEIAFFNRVTSPQSSRKPQTKAA
jgi:hypothetical protein